MPPNERPRHYSTGIIDPDCDPYRACGVFRLRIPGRKRPHVRGLHHVRPGHPAVQPAGPFLNRERRASPPTRPACLEIFTSRITKIEKPGRARAPRAFTTKPYKHSP